MLNLKENDDLFILSSKCKQVQTRNFNKGEIIMNYIEKRDKVGMIKEGKAELIRFDYEGNKTIIEHFSKNDIFGELFHHINYNNELIVLATEKCEVMFLNANCLEKKCSRNCGIHDLLVEKFVHLLALKIVTLNEHIEFLTKKSIREKLLSYFDRLSHHKIKRRFTLPMSYTDLADYLNIDRSALMRELKNLQEEGFIEKEDRKITILY